MEEDEGEEEGEGNCEPKKPGRMAIKEYRIPSSQRRQLSIQWIDAVNATHPISPSPIMTVGQSLISQSQSHIQ